MKYQTEMEIFRRRLRGDVPDHRVGHLVQEMEPFKEEMIPYLLGALGEGYFTFGENAASVLAYIGDCQFIPSLLEHFEERATCKSKLRINFIKNAALSASENERQCIVDSFISHLTKRRDKKDEKLCQCNIGDFGCARCPQCARKYSRQAVFAARARDRKL